eukprot:gnl/TRDRNA2_/TRDRNA2_172082_c0_seq6.p1 gnl/TRDRNA2_/TRDRNA2_172082_c0~~gnl/TRDRNA2_/TRDRNA2_172082_c0_seq6.p1  ORF type:complete len:227 (-),score=22.71 gnl/TRDRNA2_/TRDRNA2_172082_c0_seq6:41-721(-)
MIIAMRYGHSRSVALPSGYIESDAAETTDMDVYVLTDRWQEFSAALTEYATEAGFEWCGWTPGWPKYSMFCWSGAGELEVHLADRQWGSRLALALAPPSRCRIAPGPGVVGEAFELPCPRDPWGFMRYVWRHRPAFMYCLPLPVGRYSGPAELAEEDVRFLWSRSQELEAAGFASMAWYYSECRNHPNAAQAQALYWEDWKSPYATKANDAAAVAIATTSQESSSG